MSNRLRYPVYRCEKCKRLLTRLEIVAKWERAEAAASQPATIALCACGGGRISPANPTLWEELTSPRLWRQAWRDRWTS